MRETMNPALRILLAEPFPRAAAYRLYDTAGCHASSWRSCLLQITRCYERVAGRLLFSRCRVQRTRGNGRRSPLPSAAHAELRVPIPPPERSRYEVAGNVSTAERGKSGVAAAGPPSSAADPVSPTAERGKSGVTGTGLPSERSKSGVTIGERSRSGVKATCRGR